MAQSKVSAIAQDLVDKIKHQQYKPGEYLPSEHQLMDLYGASRETIRKALTSLTDLGLIQKIRGKGSIVLNLDRYTFPISGISSFAELNNQLGLKAETKVLLLQKEDHLPTGFIKYFPEEKNSAGFHLERLRLIEGQADVLDCDYLLSPPINSLPKDAAETSIYNYLENKEKLEISYATKEISVCKVDKRIQDLLQLDNKLAVLVASRNYLADTTKFEFGRYYKFDIPTTVKADVPGGVDIENTAAQVVNYYNPTTKKVEKPNVPTEKRVNSVPISVEFNFTKRLEGRELKANEFTFELKDAAGKVVETVSNDASGNVKFSKLEFKKGQEGVHKYTVEEVKGTDATVTYDTMKANVTVTVKHDGTAKVLIATVGDIADKEFNNIVRPPEEPKFQPEKYVVNKEKFDITGNKLVDDDKELADKYADTNANPYADDASNNEKENLNTKTVKRGDKLVYQVWLDTTKFTEAHNVQSVGVTDVNTIQTERNNVKNVFTLFNPFTFFPPLMIQICYLPMANIYTH